MIMIRIAQKNNNHHDNHDNYIFDDKDKMEI